MYSILNDVDYSKQMLDFKWDQDTLEQTRKAFRDVWLLLLLHRGASFAFTLGCVKRGCWQRESQRAEFTLTHSVVSFEVSLHI